MSADEERVAVDQTDDEARLEALYQRASLAALRASMGRAYGSEELLESP